MDLKVEILNILWVKYEHDTQNNPTGLDMPNIILQLAKKGLTPDEALIKACLDELIANHIVHTVPAGHIVAFTLME